MGRGKPYSMDLRERVVAAVDKGGLSCHKAAAQFGVGVNTAILWVRRFRETGSFAPGQMGGHKPKAISGKHRDWLLERAKVTDFTLRGLVAELAERGLKVDYRSVLGVRPHRESQLQKKASSPANATVLTSPAGARNGRSIRARSKRGAWCLSTRPGPRPIWQPCGAGRRAAPG
jgi:transposase